MKKTELAKHLGLKILGHMQKAPIPNRFGTAAGNALDRREQRKLDQAAGLVPFAVKLHQDLVRRLNEQAVREGIDVAELTARLIDAGLDKAPAKQAASKAAIEQKTSDKKATADKPAAKTAVKTAATKKAAEPKAPVTQAPAKKAATKNDSAKKAAPKKATAKQAPAPKPGAKAPAKKAKAG